MVAIVTNVQCSYIEEWRGVRVFYLNKEGIHVCYSLCQGGSVFNLCKNFLYI